MMNILLTNSAAPICSPFVTGEKRFPTGIGFLISVLRNYGVNVLFLDNYLSPTYFYQTGYVIEKKIDFVGIFSSHTEVYIEDIYAFMKIARKYDIEVMIWDGDYVKFLVGDNVVYYTDRIFHEVD